MRRYLHHFPKNCNPTEQYKIQAWCGDEGWKDTKYSHQFRHDAERIAQELLADKSRWMNGEPTQVRIIDTEVKAP